MAKIFILLFIPSIFSQDLLFPEYSVSDEAIAIPDYGYRIIADSIESVGLNINKFESSKNENYTVLSPTSIACALYMVLVGSNGNTYNELYNFLKLNPLTYIELQENIFNEMKSLEITGNDQNIIQIANGLFVNQDISIRPAFRDTITNFFDAEIKNFDFKNQGDLARNQINEWVSNKTNKKITNLLNEPPNPDTKMILVNSLYFKGVWEKPFPPHLTKMQNFYPKGHTNSEKIQVPIMATMGTFKYYYDPILNLEVVGIPYKGKAIVFYLILPKNSTPDKLKNIENRINTSKLNELINNTKDTSQMIVAIPKMKLTSQFLLNTALQQLGVTSLFDPSQSDLSLISNQPIPKRPANIFNDEQIIFSRTNARVERDTPKNGLIKDPKALERKVVPNSGLFVNEIIHKVTIDVNENGTEAAASTLVFFEKTVSVTVKADAPFLFFIRHEPSNMVLFQGSVIVPV